MTSSEILRGFIKDALSAKASRVKKWNKTADLYSILKSNLGILGMMGLQASSLDMSETFPLRIKSPAFPNNTIYVYVDNAVNIL